MRPEKIIKLIVTRRHRLKKNTIIAITGDPGEGKSYVALRIGEIIDENFDPEKQVIYHPKDILARIEEARKHRYKVLILDEAHVTIPARLWYSATNLAINFVLTTFRQLHRLCVIVVSPSLEEVDKSLRRLINYYFIISRTSNKFAYVFPYQIKINRYAVQDQKAYLKRFMFQYEGKIYRVKSFLMKKPNEEICEKYEKIATEFKAGLLKRKLSQLEMRFEKDADERKKTLEEIITWLFENPKILKRAYRRKRDGTIKLYKGMFKKIFKLDETEMIELEGKIEEELKNRGWI